MFSQRICRASHTPLTRRDFIHKAGQVGVGAAFLGITLSDSALAVFADTPKADELIALALAEVKRGGADYGDIRLVRAREQWISARIDRIEAIYDGDSYGYGIRCLIKGAWGFASSNEFTLEAVRATARRAVEIARASTRVRSGKGVRLAPEAAQVANYRTPRQSDPFGIDIDTKTSLLLTACETMRKTPEVRFAAGYLALLDFDRQFASTEGAHIHTEQTIVNGGISAIAVQGDERQSRSYEISPINSGWERVVAGDLAGNAARVAAEAKDKLRADEAPSGLRDLVLDPLHISLTIHESVGHATELDRLLGDEANFAGTSWVNPKEVGKLKFGSKFVHIAADNLDPRGLASLGFDDDGVAAQKWDIIRDGVLVGFSDSRELAGRTGAKRSHGSCRAEGWNAVPIVRIANVSLQPAPDPVTPDDLISDVQEGIYISGTGTWSIDQRRLNFQFGGDCFWRIKNGKKAGMYKDVVYRGISPQFWGACNGVAGAASYEPVGYLNCGKGQPEQTGRMTHGAVHARFRQIEVGKGRA